MQCRNDFPVLIFKRLELQFISIETKYLNGESASSNYLAHIRDLAFR